MIAAINVTSNIWWYFARAGGLVAWGLLAASVFWGLIFAGRLTRTRPTPAWNLDLHRFLGGLAVIFVVIHVSALMADRYVHFGLAEVLVPFASHWRPGAVAWGIVALYLVLAIEATSLAMRWLPRKVWRKIHLLSFVLFTVSTVHAIQSGTDTAKPLVRGIGIVLLLTASLTLVLRVVAAHQKAAARNRTRSAAAIPAPVSIQPVATPSPAPQFGRPANWTTTASATLRDDKVHRHDRPVPAGHPSPAERPTTAPAWTIANPLARPLNSPTVSVGGRRLEAASTGRDRPPSVSFSDPTPPPRAGAHPPTGSGGSPGSPLSRLHGDLHVASRAVAGRTPGPAQTTAMPASWPPIGRPPKVARFAEPSTTSESSTSSQ